MGYAFSAAVAAVATLAIVRAGRQAATPEDADMLPLPQQSESGALFRRQMHDTPVVPADFPARRGESHPAQTGTS